VSLEIVAVRRGCLRGDFALCALAVHLVACTYKYSVVRLPRLQVKYALLQATTLQAGGHDSFLSSH
jgi:hypothetical protein